MGTVLTYEELSYIHNLRLEILNEIRNELIIN